MIGALILAAIVALCFTVAWLAWAPAMYDLGPDEDLDDVTWGPLTGARGAVLFDGDEPIAVVHFDEEWTEFELADLGILGRSDGDRD